MKRLAKTYVWHDGKCWFVSTINRESSAMAIWYAETLVWTSAGDLIYQGEAGRDSIKTHQAIVESLARCGRCT